MGVVGRLLEHPPVEMQPGQLPIDESLGAFGELKGRRGLGRRRNQVRCGFFFRNKDLAAISHGEMLPSGGNIAIIDDDLMT